MDKASIIVTQRAIIAQNPIEATFTKADESTQTVTVGVANTDVTALQMVIGNQKSYRRSVWSILDDWDELPDKRDKVTIDDVIYRIMDYRDYYMETVRRFDLGDEYENGGD